MSGRERHTGHSGLAWIIGRNGVYIDSDLASGIIAGIYHGIREGAFDVPLDFEAVVDRE